MPKILDFADGFWIERYEFGQALGVKITTNGAWDGTTSDITVNVCVLFEGVQP